MEIFGASMKLPMKVVTDVDESTVSPKNLFAHSHSTSKPTTLPSAPAEREKFQFLSSQSNASRHPESPPKL